MNFCTYFDSYYLLKGLGLYLSLERVSDDFHLYVMAFDKECYDKLQSFGFSHMTVDFWDEWETPEIKAVKEDRNRAEYCWTCGPTVIYHFLTHYNLPDITYLDSDLYFIGNPQIAFDEIGSASVAITEQAISKKAEEMYGKYCVQFMFFRNDSNGTNALIWWRDACIDWCYQKFEDNKFGDQKYLDQFPIKFDNVYIMQNPGIGVAPWNMYRYHFRNEGEIIIKNEKEYPVVFFHMHGLKAEITGELMQLKSSDAIITSEMDKLFFSKYAILLVKVFNEYLAKNLTKCEIKGQSRWRAPELYIRGKLNKIAVLRKLYYYLFGMKEHNSGTVI